MSSSKKIPEFPDVEEKLKRATKQSAFERQKAEAEAKRRREAAETAAVYEDFVKSFDHDDDTSDSRPSNSRYGNDRPERPTLGGQAFGGTGKRHFGVNSLKSGPGSLGPPPTSLKSGPGSLGPPPTSFKKRSYDDFHSSRQRPHDESRSRPEFEERERGRDRDRDRDRERDFEKSSLPVSKVFNDSDNEEEATVNGRAEEKAVSKPTLRLSNLPPSTSPAVIKALIPPNLTVESVKIVPPSGPQGTERKSIAAIVTLSKETPATDIDAAVSALQNRYLGYGYFLSLHRHLSSAAIASGLTAIQTSTTVSHPFGAKRVEEKPSGHGPHHGGYGRNYAPPSHYGPPGAAISRSGLLHVPVKPPRDIRTLRMIHKVVESVLEHGPEFEALLMSRPDVQREERWAWIWDARSEGGIWYRWRLWEIVTGSQTKRGKPKYVPLFEGSHAWKAPEPLAYEYTTSVDEIVSDSAYDTDEEDDFEDEQKEHNDQEDTFLNPIEKAKLAHMLARLPTTLSKIRKGDIARITAFAITHASRGADEIVDMIISNVESPLSYTPANPDHQQHFREREGQDGNNNNNNSRETSPAPAEDKDKEKTNDSTHDLSAARLVGLYVISDVLSSSSTSGIRHAWRYRQLFETALRARKTFELLGMMADKLNWGRLRADKWKRSVGLVLSLWEGWCVFPVETHEFFVNSFENPPTLKAKEAQREEAEKKAAAAATGGGKWKTVDGGPAATTMTQAKATGFLPVSTLPETSTPVDTEAGADSEYVERMLETGDTDGELAALPPNYMQYSSGTDELFSDEDDIDGTPDEDFMALLRMLTTVDDGDVVMGEATATETSASAPPPTTESKTVAGFQISANKAAQPTRKRMRAVDMFAGSDSEGEKK
ncbi:hypothetical protein SMACR_03407 [Sordaria macrospora]|uniref:WGS project CABT00000000 data, contig 2.10 n=2 Tax=Sordaria macrospora TaxID=5147 RepID=F7VW29_SORMK|nr:uncharacterized protein SMAC_03407 [Sordaria macrospora k-hell]KAA8632922.1 hypothetical protein SMACR_03407 [Sordaria macrospora]KAH7629940.1 hypothetical protein B0T09DRAFT_340650 [Sordaria sp. MPI-SDFR-AT-0083]WPJ66632.1 hypothetical protein SMAC4_03407 [Sordaria macrospora]CCC09851.1 unnamed protein product [Sordaria macrospora k-hell]